ncbi:MAG TPA: hypothetical protein PLJ23_10370 [Gemmatimonadales bacterium]|nr:hypothetical protein [Gemmatimonadales bacterium]
MSHPSRVSAALIVGMLGSLVVMALHPTGQDVVAIANAGGRDVMARAIHAFAIGLQPLLLAGYLGLALMLPNRDLAVFGVVTYAVGTSAVVGAATLAGLVITPLLEASVSTTGVAQEIVLSQIRFAFAMNQALTKVFVSLGGIAIACWSIAMRGDARFPATLRWLGITVAVIGVGGIAAGRLALDVQGFGMIVLGQASWTCWAAVCVARTRA